MCVEIQYRYRDCGCTSRIGHYVCAASKEVGNGFDTSCDRFKVTSQVKKVGHLMCIDHERELEEQLERERELAKRAAEEFGDVDGYDTDDEEETLDKIDLDDREIPTVLDIQKGPFVPVIEGLKIQKAGKSDQVEEGEKSEKGGTYGKIEKAQNVEQIERREKRDKVKNIEKNRKLGIPMLKVKKVKD